MRKKLNHEVGSVYTKQVVSDTDLNEMFMDTISMAIGILGISVCIIAFAILPWSTL